MTRNNAIRLSKCAALLSAVPLVLYAMSSGAPARSTGAPGDQTCAACHTGTAVGNQVSITYSGGSSYTPGQRGKFTVTIADRDGRQAFGFQASARLASNEQAGQAGTLVAGQGTTLVCDDDRPAPCAANAVQFITHSQPNNTGTFEFEWDPPATASGDVKVYVAGNAANGNRTNTGDRIHTASITLTPAATGGGGTRPAISSGGVADAFNFQAGVAENTWVALFGQNLSSETRTWDGSPELARGELPTSLGGVSVTINGKAAPVYAVSPTQVNVLAPLDNQTGDVQVVIRTAAGESQPATARKVNLLPGLYAPFAQNGRLFVTGVENSTGALLGKTGVDPRVARAFRPGDVVQFYANGLGATNPAVPANQFVRTPAALVNAPTIRINDVPVEVLGSALVNSGLFQVNARIPALDPGDYPIVVSVAGASSANNVSITIQR